MLKELAGLSLYFLNLPVDWVVSEVLFRSLVLVLVVTIVSLFRFFKKAPYQDEKN